MIKTVPTFVTMDGRSHLDPDHAIAHERHVQVVNVLLVERHSLELDLSDVEKTAKAICLTQHQVQMIFGVDHGLHRGGLVKGSAGVVGERPTERFVMKDPRLAMPFGRTAEADTAQRVAATIRGDLPNRPGGPVPNSVEVNQTVERPWPPSDMRDETGHVASPLGKAVNEIVDKIEEQRRAHPTTGLLPHPDSPEGRRRALRHRHVNERLHGVAPAMQDPMDKLLSDMAAELSDPVRYDAAG